MNKGYDEVLCSGVLLDFDRGRFYVVRLLTGRYKLVQYNYYF